MRTPRLVQHVFDVAARVVAHEETLDWLALRMVPGLGPLGAVRLLDRLKTPRAIFRASASELEAAGMSQAQARHIASGCSFEDAADQQQRVLDAGAQLIVIHDPLYPLHLREIFDPPLLLFAIGRTELMSSHCLAIVGTRRPTPYGMAATERVSADLAKAGLTIVSGMARGIDTAAHTAALREDGSTIAVLGCGVDVLYPVDNRTLYKEIGSRGLL
ncbi:MAG: DNA-processing protein DprA, partial [Acidobacteriaceae bacterium]|nr:DNA-processing protein DprA [Acidobacteriaceae bacterium]